MRLQGESRDRRPSILLALVIFVVLVLLVQQVSQRQTTRPLQEHFAASSPASDEELQFPPVPTQLVPLVQTTTALISGGQAAPALTPVAQTDTLRIEIDQIASEEEGLRITGNVINISPNPVDVSLDAFRFIDADNGVYVSSGSPTTTLQPGQQAPIDLQLPITDPTGLQLEITLPDQPPIEMILLSHVATPTP
jgi:hypothetical protein